MTSVKPTQFMARADYKRRRNTLNVWLNPEFNSVLEISPLDSPLVPRLGANKVVYVDSKSEEALRKEMADQPLRNPEELVELDYVLDGRPLNEVVKERFDWIIASRSLEYQPDLIGWLNSLADVLNRGGFLFCAIPDRRYCFIIDRPFTTVGEVLENHLLKRTRPAPRLAFDQSYYHKKIRAKDLWDDYDKAHEEAERSFDATRALARYQVGKEKNLKVVCNILDPENFRDIIDTTRVLGMHRWRIVKIVETSESFLDFIVLMRLDAKPEEPKQPAP